MNGLYVYALVEGGGPLRVRGLAREPLRLVPLGGIAAVVGAMPAAPAPSARNASAHDLVLRRLGRRRAAVLPARFGSFVEQEAALRERLQPHVRELGRALEQVRGRVQMTVRLFGPPEPRPAEGGGPGRRYLERLGGGSPAVEQLRLALGPLVRAERVERHSHPPLLGSVYHLIDRGRERAYRAALRGASAALGAVRVAVSGPWPPYSFGPEPLL